VMRFEANVSLRQANEPTLGTRVEIKNLNSLRAMERAIAYEIERQTRVLEAGGVVKQETLGWDDDTQATFSQRGKEEAHDYRYFPEPDLPPLIVEQDWIEQVRSTLPELPEAKIQRLQQQYNLSAKTASVLAEQRAVADYFEAVMQPRGQIHAQEAANWITGALFGWLNQTGETIEGLRMRPQDLAGLLIRVAQGEVNQNTARNVMLEMLQTGQPADKIISTKKLQQVGDRQQLARWVTAVLDEHPEELKRYLAGKETLAKWFFGQVMSLSGGKAHPEALMEILETLLEEKRTSSRS